MDIGCVGHMGGPRRDAIETWLPAASVGTRAPKARGRDARLDATGLRPAGSRLALESPILAALRHPPENTISHFHAHSYLMHVRLTWSKA